MNEIWKPVKDYEGLYEISSLGRVKNLNYRGTGKEKILKNTEDRKGYSTISLRKNGKRKLLKVHRLVAEAFIPNPESKPCVDHINTIRNDNRVENLRWVTNKENNNNPLTKKKMRETKKGENNPKNKPVVQIDPNTNEVVNTYCSAREASRQTGVNHGNISQCCNDKRKTTGGFIWKFAEN